MLAVDTNLVVRYLTGDEPQQFARAAAVIEGAEIFVCQTVLLETEWVLRSLYGYRRTQVVDALRAFAGLPGIALEDPASAGKAFDWVAQGMDFADALHLAKAQSCEAFVSFDRRLVERAAVLSAIPLRLP